MNMERFVLRPVPDLDDLPQSQGAWRGGAARHRRRPAPGPDGHRGGRRTVRRPTRPADVVGGRDPGRRLPLLRVSRRRARRPRRADAGSSSRRSPRARQRDFFGFNRAKHAVRRGGHPGHAHGVAAADGVPCSNSASSRSSSRKPAGPTEHAAFRLHRVTSARPPAPQGLDPDSEASPP